MEVFMIFFSLLSFFQNNSHAANCQTYVNQAASAKGKNLIQAYENLAVCDKNMATTEFETFMKRANEIDTLSKLANAAVDADIFDPIWKLPGNLADYTQRDDLVRSFGEMCNDSPKIISFFQGAYIALNDNDFGYWDVGFTNCTSAEFTTWLESSVKNPPQKNYSDKYNTILKVYTNQSRVEGLGTLSEAAIASAENGPFNDILNAMDAAVKPPLGQKISPSDQEAFNKAMLKVAQTVPSKAQFVADRLISSGSNDAAAKLLPTLFADRYAGGYFSYVGAAIELADCSGEKTAIIHYNVIKESGKIWGVQSKAEEQKSSWKPKLKKCTAEQGEWLVLSSPHPVLKEGEEWLQKVEKQYTDKGYKVSLKKEKDLIVE